VFPFFLSVASVISVVKLLIDSLFSMERSCPVFEYVSLVDDFFEFWVVAIPTRRFMSSYSVNRKKSFSCSFKHPISLLEYHSHISIR